MTNRVIPDYTNQLELFSEAPGDTPAPVVKAPARNSGQARPRPQQLGFDVWEPLPPFDAGAVAATKPNRARSDGDGGMVHRLPVRPDIATPDGITPSGGNGDRQNRSTGKILDIEPEEKPPATSESPARTGSDKAVCTRRPATISRPSVY